MKQGKIYKVYDLEKILDTFLNKNGVSLKIIKEMDGELSKELGSFENFDLNETDPEIDMHMEVFLNEDIDIPENETEEENRNRLIRYQKIVNFLKQKYGYKCQICGYSFLMDNGKGYFEAHHVKMLSDNGSQSPENVIILCANHHRMFHYATGNTSIGKLIDGKRVIKIGNKELNIEF